MSKYVIDVIETSRGKFTGMVDLLNDKGRPVGDPYPASVDQDTEKEAGVKAKEWAVWMYDK
jgi:hypothetical protein